MDERTVLENAIEHYGKHNQVDKACEEMCELISALMRYRCMQTEVCLLDKAENDLPSDEAFDHLQDLRDNIQEEIADVEIMLKQLKMIYCADAIETVRALKIRRLAKKLNLI